MEDAFALIVLTLLQLCRAETTSTEWFAANLINDPSYTPKPITEIFTTDLTFIPKSPTIPTLPTSRETKPPTISTTTSPLFSTTAVTEEIITQQIQTESTPQIIGTIPQRPQLPQVNDPQKSDIPSFVLYFDPRQQNQIFGRPVISALIPNEQTIEEPKSTEAPLTTPSTTTLAQSTAQVVTRGPSILTPIVGNPQQTPTYLLVPSTSIAGRWNEKKLIPVSNFPTDNSNLNSTVPASSTQQPAQPENRKPLITVRVKSIKGSVTNIRINPSTTIRPVTTRRRKLNKKSNDYETCVNSCDGRREPICSSPAGVSPVDPDRLKGFASLCHMACHNSFRKDQVYDKLADGRCGRLRTRIRPLDKNKLNREDLNKAQYTIVHNAPETVMEFSPLKR